MLLDEARNTVTAQMFQQYIGDSVGKVLVLLVGGPTQMRRENDVWQRQQRMTAR